MNYLIAILGIGVGSLAFWTYFKKNAVLSKDGNGIAQYLIAKGYSKENASGIAGNLYVESKYDPLAVGDNGNSFGLAQWHKDRWEKLNEYARANNVDPNTFKGQLDYLDYELRNSEKKAMAELLKAETPHESAYAFAKYFERPKWISPERMLQAEAIFKQI